MYTSNSIEFAIQQHQTTTTNTNRKKIEFLELVEQTIGIFHANRKLSVYNRKQRFTVLTLMNMYKIYLYCRKCNNHK